MISDRNELIHLYAGPLRMEYENGFIRYIRNGDREIVRMLYFALRDENWMTYPIQISDQHVHRTDTSFSIKYNAHHHTANDPIIHWEVIIEGTEEGRVSIEIKGDVQREFLKNRVGCCVLHPVEESKGMPATILHANGEVERTEFPVMIAAKNPFLNIASMSWTNGTDSFCLEFQGDVFETEDQRNWTDASFKTFCTPLNIPFPVKILKGQTIHQRITFWPQGKVKESIIESRISHMLTGDEYRIPEIGVGSSVHDRATPEIKELMQFLNPSHYRVDVFFSRDDWFADYLIAAAFARYCSLPLELVFHLEAEYESGLNSIIAYHQANPLRISSVVLLSANALVTSESAAKALSVIRSFCPKVPVGIGTDYNFTELNRGRPESQLAEFVTFAIQPQEHAFDDKTMIENIAAQMDAVRSAMKLYPGKNIHVSPITLRRRFNPYAADEGRKVITKEERTDPRQTSVFNAVWTLGSIKSLTESGARSFTLFELTGSAGICSGNGKPYPVFHAIAEIMRRKFHFVKGSVSTHPLEVNGIIFSDNTGLFWNYTAERKEVWFRENAYILSPHEIRSINF